MKVYCSICNKESKIDKSFAKMTCHCDDDNRILCLDKIKNGYYIDSVYLFENNECYDEKKSILCALNG